MSKQLNEVDFVVIDPRGNIKPAGMKIQASMYAKKMGGPRKGYFVIPKKNAKKAQKLYGRHTYIYIMGILSDAQLMIEHKQYNTARQSINKAKLLISDRASEYLERAKG